MENKIVQTSEPHSPEQPLPNVPMHKRNIFPLVIIAILVVISLLLGIGGYILGDRKVARESVSPQTNKALPSQQPAEPMINTDTVLKPYIVDFDNLNVTKLPNFVDVRGVYPYNGNEIVTGVDQIVEHNPAKGTLVRVLDRTKMDSVLSTAIIGDYLYVVSAPGLLSKGIMWPDLWARIYRIDLKTGKITKQYFGNPASDVHHINLSIASEGDYIWVSSNDGVFRINTKDDTMKTYGPLQLTMNPSCLSNLFNKDNVIFTLVNCDNKLGRLIYNKNNDSWSFEALDSKGFSGLINLRLEDLGINLPSYSHVSNVVNGKRYLFSDKGIYTLVKNQFPKLYKNVVISSSLASSPVEGPGVSGPFVTRDEKYALFVGPQICGALPIDQCSPVIVGVLDLKTGAMEDLLKDNTIYDAMSTDNKIKLTEELSSVIAEEKGNSVIFKNEKTKKTILTVDTSLKTASFAN